MTPEWMAVNHGIELGLAISVLTLACLTIFFAWKWRAEVAERKRGQERALTDRKQQKRFDHQRNIGRRIHNALLGYIQKKHLGSRVTIAQIERDGEGRCRIVVALKSRYSKYEFGGAEFWGYWLVQIFVNLDEAIWPIRAIVGPCASASSEQADPETFGSTTTTDTGVEIFIGQACKELENVLLHFAQIRV